MLFQSIEALTKYLFCHLNYKRIAFPVLKGKAFSKFYQSIKKRRRVALVPYKARYLRECLIQLAFLEGIYMYI